VPPLGVAFDGVLLPQGEPQPPPRDSATSLNHQQSQSLNPEPAKGGVKLTQLTLVAPGKHARTDGTETSTANKTRRKKAGGRAKDDFARDFVIFNVPGDETSGYRCIGSTSCGIQACEHLNCNFRDHKCTKAPSGSSQFKPGRVFSHVVSCNALDDGLKAKVRKLYYIRANLMRDRFIDTSANG
jgi:hypothetical protein